MALFTPENQLRNMQQHYAAQQLLGGRQRADQSSALMKVIAANALLSSTAHIDDDLFDIFGAAFALGCILLAFLGYPAYLRWRRPLLRFRGAFAGLGHGRDGSRRAADVPGARSNLPTKNERRC